MIMKRMALINISELPWSEERRRNQAIFQKLVTNENIFDLGVYVNPPKYSNDSFWKYERIKAISSVSSVKKIQKSITVISPDFSLPFSFKKSMAKLLATKIMKTAVKEIGDRKYVLWINNAGHHMYHIAKKLMKCSGNVIIDLSDDWLTYDRNGSVQSERKARLDDLINNSDIMIAVNDHVASKYRHKNTIVFNNATDYKIFRDSTEIYHMQDYFPKPADRIYIGFIGGLHRGRVDEDLLYRLFQEFKEYTFIFVGHSNDNRLIETISRFQNVKFIHTVPYNILPSIIKSFDVAIVPHLINEHTRGNDLLKVLDYMAAGVPVVTTNCSNVKKYDNALYIADNHQEFIQYVRGLASGTVHHDSDAGYEVAQTFSWDRTVPELEMMISKKLNLSN